MSEPAMTDFRMFAGYNDWANKRLYEAAARLPDTSYRAARGVYFGSLHGTLNHILVADRIWMRRFTREGPLPVRLDEILYDELPALTAARHEEDERIIAYTAGLNEAELDSAITYETVTNPAPQTQKLRNALAHFFNHQTHHRGQAHAVLTMTGGNQAAPPLDLLIFQRQAEIGLP